MSNEQQQRIFQDFTQVDGSYTRGYGEFGLGLTIARRLVKLLNGSLRVTSAPGQGTTFFVPVPFKPAQEQGHGRDFNG